MPFLTYCDNKGCKKEQSPLLDTETNDVICAECNQPIKTVTEFAKRQMKTLGQVLRKKKTRSAYAVKCSSCNVESTPVIKDDELACSSCSSKLNLSKPFERIVRAAIKE